MEKYELFKTIFPASLGALEGAAVASQRSRWTARKQISLIQNSEHLLIWVQCFVIDKIMLPMMTGQNIFENNKTFSREYSIITCVSFSQWNSYMTGIPTWKHRNCNNVLRLVEPSLQHTWLQSLCNRGLRVHLSSGSGRPADDARELGLSPLPTTPL